MRIREVLTYVLLSAGVTAFAQLNSPVSYSSNDSLVMLGDGTAFLHGSSVVKYEKMELDAEYIRIKSDSSTIYAVGSTIRYMTNGKASRCSKKGKTVTRAAR